MKIKINALSKADTVIGQGVGSAYIEQIKLIKEMSNDFDIEINSKSSDFDIYHLHTVNFRYKLRMNKKHLNIVYVHFVPSKNDGSIGLPKFLVWLFNKYVESVYRKADEVVVVNPCFIPELEKIKIPREKITYIPNFVNKNNFYPLEPVEIIKIKDKYNLPKDKFIVLGCGQIQNRKDFENFVKVARSNPDLYFAWVGGFSFGRISDGYRKNKKLLENLPQNMTYLGLIERKYMNEVFNAVDVLFMPSFIELFPMTILEVCNIGKPFLVRDLDLYKPIFFSRYCKGNNNEEFSEELNKLKNDITYYKSRVEDSKFIANFYNKDLLKKTWKDYYHRVYEKWKKQKELA